MNNKYCQFCKHWGAWGECLNPEICICGDVFEPAMSPERFAERMIEVKNHFEGDEECVHVAMDKIMCNLLEKLGYEHGVKVFKDTPKHWA